MNQIVTALMLLLLAAFNAWVGLSKNPTVYDNDDGMYFSPTLYAEGFWRAFIINITFASTAMAANIPRDTPWLPWIGSEANIAIVNIIYCFAAACVIKSELKNKANTERARTIAAFLAGALVLFFISVALLHAPQSTLPHSPQPQAS